MDIPASLLPPAWLWASFFISLAVVAHLVRTAPWKRLETATQLNLLLGLVFGLVMLWSMRAGTKPGLNLHLLGAMVATLALGPPLAIVALGLALAGIALNGALEWQAWPFNFLLMAVVPVYLANLWLRLIERHLPAHFFVFIFVVAFIGSALTVMCQGLLATGALALAGAYPLRDLAAEYLPYFLLLGFSEAWTGGFVITLMVVYRPEWVAAFDDRRYLINK